MLPARGVVGKRTVGLRSRRAASIAESVICLKSEEINPSPNFPVPISPLEVKRKDQIQLSDLLMSFHLTPASWSCREPLASPVSLLSYQF